MVLRSQSKAYVNWQSTQFNWAGKSKWWTETGSFACMGERVGKYSWCVCCVTDQHAYSRSLSAMHTAIGTANKRKTDGGFFFTSLLYHRCVCALHQQSLTKYAFRVRAEIATNAYRVSERERDDRWLRVCVFVSAHVSLIILDVFIEHLHYSLSTTRFCVIRLIDCVWDLKEKSQFLFYV